MYLSLSIYIYICMGLSPFVSTRGPATPASGSHARLPPSLSLTITILYCYYYYYYSYYYLLLLLLLLISITVTITITIPINYYY